jgi:hypothetical protein
MENKMKRPQTDWVGAVVVALPDPPLRRTSRLTRQN